MMYFGKVIQICKIKNDDKKIEEYEKIREKLKKALNTSRMGWKMV